MTENESVGAPKSKKRKYAQMSKCDFIKIANASLTQREIAEKTGYSLAGVRAKLLSLKAHNVALKKCLFEDARKHKKTPVV